MNCSEFQKIVHDLAQCDQPDSEHFSGGTQRQREDGLAHARVCADCDETLAEAASLTVGLRALAHSYARAETPARVEKALVAAYRRSRVAAMKPMRAHRHVPAAVTGLTIAAGLAMAVFLHHPAKHTTLSHTIAPPGIALSTPAPAEQNPDGMVRDDAAQSGATRRQSVQTPPDPSNRPPVSVASGKPPYSSHNASSFEDISATNGTFMPLPYADEGPIENATVIRAVLPGTALGAFGLPVTDGAAEGKVVADFIVGEDGTPEAIRIVR